MGCPPTEDGSEGEQARDRAPVGDACPAGGAAAAAAWGVYINERFEELQMWSPSAASSSSFVRRRKRVDYISERTTELEEWKVSAASYADRRFVRKRKQIDLFGREALGAKDWGASDVSASDCKQS
eukprot:1141391-Pyramimonas_sp.AAC.1